MNHERDSSGRSIHRWLLAATLPATVCSPDAVPTPVIDKPPAVAVSVATIQGLDASVPDAAAAFAAQHAADAIKVQADTGPPNTLSKEQESKAMPMPG